MNPLTLDSRSSIAEAFFTTAEANPAGIVFEQAVQEANNPDDVRTWRKSTFAEVRGRVLSLANFLRSKGVSRGVRVAIISNSRPEWMEADLAVQSLGGKPARAPRAAAARKAPAKAGKTPKAASKAAPKAAVKAPAKAAKAPRVPRKAANKAAVASAS